MYGVWADMLKECVAKFGHAPRKFSMMDRVRYMRINKPGWMKADSKDTLNALLDHQGEIFESGVVVWGQLVQANTLLFEKGKDNCPASVLYAPDPELQMDPSLLETTATKLYELKKTTPRDEEQAALARWLTDEVSRPMGIEIPRSICMLGEMVMSTTFFARHHLPLKMLRGNILPMVRHEYDLRLVLPMPERFWPKRLVEWWKEN